MKIMKYLLLMLILLSAFGCSATKPSASPSTNTDADENIAKVSEKIASPGTYKSEDNLYLMVTPNGNIFHQINPGSKYYACLVVPGKVDHVQAKYQSDHAAYYGEYELVRDGNDLIFKVLHTERRWKKLDTKTIPEYENQ